MLSYPKTLHLTLMEKLGEHATNPPGYPNQIEYHYVTMYMRVSTMDMDQRVMLLFFNIEGTLRLIIATTAFSMGIDCHW